MDTSYRVPEQFSIFGTFIWMIFLSIGIQAIFGTFAAFSAMALGVEDSQIELLLMRPDLLAAVSVAAALCAFPLLKKAAYASNRPFPFEFLALKKIQGATLGKVMLAGLAYYALANITSVLLSIEMPGFMLDMKSQVDSGLDLALLVFCVCILAPVVEEVIFRGLAFARLSQSRVGVRGAIIITSLVFTLIHTQYDVMVLAVLSALAFLLGYVRYKTGNLIYCIALHAQINTLSTIELFWLY